MSAAIKSRFAAPGEMFNPAQMERLGGGPLCLAGRGLESAFKTARAIEGVATVIRANDLCEDFGEGILSPDQKDQLITAIIIMASSLSNELQHSQEWFDEKIKQKGGA